MIAEKKKLGRPKSSANPRRVGALEPRICVYCGAVFVPRCIDTRACGPAHRMAIAGDEKRGVKAYGSWIPATDEGHARWADLAAVPRRTNRGGAPSQEAEFDWREIPMSPPPFRPDLLGVPQPASGVACRFGRPQRIERVLSCACGHPAKPLARHLVDVDCISLRSRNLCPWGRA